jgi:hypothetical protein
LVLVAQDSAVAGGEVTELQQGLAVGGVDGVLRADRVLKFESSIDM